MADLIITATQVLHSANAKVTRYTAGAGVTITAGQTVYDSGSKVAALADADTSETTAQTKGIALNGASPGQYVDVLEDGIITLGAGAAPAIGVPYFQSPVAGGIAPLADLLTGDYLTYIGTGIGSDQVDVKIHITGALKA